VLQFFGYISSGFYLVHILMFRFCDGLYNTIFPRSSGETGDLIWWSSDLLLLWERRPWWLIYRGVTTRQIPPAETALGAGGIKIPMQK
jgi:hypothetical protein